MADGVKTYEPDAIQLYDWMWSPDGLGLSLGTIELVLFARIYAFSHHQAGLFYEPASRSAEALHVSRRSICSAIKSLVERGFIIQRGTYKHGSNLDCPKYSVAQQAIDYALLGMQIALTGSEEKSAPSQPTSPIPIAGPPEPKASKPAALEPEKEQVSSRHREAEAEINSGFQRLLEADANGGHSSRAHTYAAYRRAIDAGYSSEVILRAYHAYLDYYSRQHPNDGPRYVMRLEKFLTSGSGLRFFGKPGDKPKAEIKFAFPQEAVCPKCGSVGKLLGGTDDIATYMCEMCVVGFKRTAEELRFDDSA